MLLIIAPLAVLYALVLLFKGLPEYMHLKRNDETRFYAACVVMVGFLVLLTTGFIFMELWWHPMTGAEYVGSPDATSRFFSRAMDLSFSFIRV